MSKYIGVLCVVNNESCVGLRVANCISNNIDLISGVESDIFATYFKEQVGSLSCITFDSARDVSLENVLNLDNIALEVFNGSMASSNGVGFTNTVSLLLYDYELDTFKLTTLSYNSRARLGIHNLPYTLREVPVRLNYRDLLKGEELDYKGVSELIHGLVTSNIVLQPTA